MTGWTPSCSDSPSSSSGSARSGSAATAGAGTSSRRACRPASGGAAGPGARDLLLPGGRVRVARVVRRRLHLGRGARVDGRGQPASDRVARGDRGGVRGGRVRRAPARLRRRAAAHRGRASGAAGKAVLFATEDVVIGDSERWLERGVRDVPHPGERIAAGRPICTVVTTAATPHDALAGLEEQAARLRAELRARRWRRVADATCAGCGCACDDIEVTVADGRLAGRRGRARSATRGSPSVAATGRRSPASTAAR